MTMRTAVLGLAAMLIAVTAAAAAPNMYLVQADADTMTVLDRSSLVQVGQNVRRAEFHTFYSHPLPSDSGTIQHLLRMSDFDCAKHLHRTTHVSGFTTNDKRVVDHDTGSDSGAAWAKVEPDSNERLDERSICHPPIAARHLAYESGQQTYADYLNTVIEHHGR